MASEPSSTATEGAGREPGTCACGHPYSEHAVGLGCYALVGGVDDFCACECNPPTAAVPSPTEERLNPTPDLRAWLRQWSAVDAAAQTDAGAREIDFRVQVVREICAATGGSQGSCHSDKGRIVREKDEAVQDRPGPATPPPTVTTPDLRRAAERALASLDARTGENVEEWARRIGRDIANAPSDNEARPTSEPVSAETPVIDDGSAETERERDGVEERIREVREMLVANTLHWTAGRFDELVGLLRERPVDARGCANCRGDRWVCENHRSEPQGHDGCGGAGEPCPACNPLASDFARVLHERDQLRSLLQPPVDALPVAWMVERRDEDGWYGLTACASERAAHAMADRFADRRVRPLGYLDRREPDGGTRG